MKKTTKASKSSSVKKTLPKVKVPKNLITEAKKDFPVGTIRAYGKDKNYLYVKIGLPDVPWAYYAPIDSAKGKEAIDYGAVVVVDGKAVGPASQKVLDEYGVTHPWAGQQIPNLVPGKALGTLSPHVTPSDPSATDDEKPAKTPKKPKAPVAVATTPVEVPKATPTPVATAAPATEPETPSPPFPPNTLIDLSKTPLFVALGQVTSDTSKNIKFLELLDDLVDEPHKEFVVASLGAIVSLPNKAKESGLWDKAFGGSSDEAINNIISWFVDNLDSKEWTNFYKTFGSISYAGPSSSFGDWLVEKNPNNEILKAGVTAAAKAPVNSPVAPPPTEPVKPAISSVENNPYKGLLPLANKLKAYAEGSNSADISLALEKAKMVTGVPLGGVLKALGTKTAEEGIAFIKKSSPFSKSMENVLGKEWETAVKNIAAVLNAPAEEKNAAEAKEPTKAPVTPTVTPVQPPIQKIAPTPMPSPAKPVAAGSGSASFSINLSKLGSAKEIELLAFVSSVYQKAYNMPGAGTDLSALAQMHDFVKGVTKEVPAWTSPELANALAFLKESKTPPGGLHLACVTNPLASNACAALAQALDLVDKSNPEKAVGPNTPKGTATSASSATVAPSVILNPTPVPVPASLTPQPGGKKKIWTADNLPKHEAVDLLGGGKNGKYDIEPHKIAQMLNFILDGAPASLEKAHALSGDGLHGTGSLFAAKQQIQSGEKVYDYDSHEFVKVIQAAATAALDELEKEDGTVTPEKSLEKEKEKEKTTPAGSGGILGGGVSFSPNVLDFNEPSLKDFYVEAGVTKKEAYSTLEYLLDGKEAVIDHALDYDATAYAVKKILNTDGSYDWDAPSKNPIMQVMGKAAITLHKKLTGGATAEGSAPVGIGSDDIDLDEVNVHFLTNVAGLDSNDIPPLMTYLLDGKPIEDEDPSIKFSGLALKAKLFVQAGTENPKTSSTVAAMTKAAFALLKKKKVAESASPDPLAPVNDDISGAAAALGAQPEEILQVANHLAFALHKGVKADNLKVPASVTKHLENPDVAPAMLAVAKHMMESGTMSTDLPGHFSPAAIKGAKVIGFLKKYLDDNMPKDTKKVNPPSAAEIQNVIDSDPVLKKFYADNSTYSTPPEALASFFAYAFNGEDVSEDYGEEAVKTQEAGLSWSLSTAMQYKQALLDPSHSMYGTPALLQILAAVAQKLDLPTVYKFETLEKTKQKKIDVSFPGIHDAVYSYLKNGWGSKALSSSKLRQVLPHLMTILNLPESEQAAKIEETKAIFWDSKEKTAFDNLVSSAKKVLKLTNSTPASAVAGVASYNKKTVLPKGAAELAKMLTLADTFGLGKAETNPFQGEKYFEPVITKKPDAPNHLKELTGQKIPFPKLNVKAFPYKAPEKSALGFLAPAYSAFGTTIQGSKWKTTDLKKSSESLSGGAGKKRIYVDPDGNKYVFKLATKKGSNVKEEFRAHAQVASSAIAQVIKPKAPKISSVILDGDPGAIYPFVDAVGTLAQFSPSELTPNQALEVAQEHLVDWICGQHDSHGANLLQVAGGGVVGIDKEQAFKYFGNDKLSVDYAPNKDEAGEEEPFYNKFWRSWANGEVEFDPQSLAYSFDKLTSMPVNFVQDAVAAYASAKYKKNNLEAQQFVMDVFSRKNTAKRDFEKFITDLYKKKEGKDGKFTFAEGWKTKGGKTFKSIGGATFISEKGGTISDFKTASGTDPGKKTIKINSNKPKEELAKILSELKLNPLGPIKTGTHYHMAFVDAAQLAAANITTEVNEKASDSIPPSSHEPTYLPSVSYYKPTKYDNSALDSLHLEENIGLAAAIPSGGTVVENQTIKVTKHSKNGKVYYQVSFKVRREGEKAFKNKGSSTVEKFRQSTFNEKTGIYEDDNGIASERSVYKKDVSNGSVCFDHTNNGYSFGNMVTVNVEVPPGKTLRSSLKTALTEFTGDANIVERILKAPTEEEKQIYKLSRLLHAFAPQEADKLPEESQRSVDSLKKALFKAGITEADIAATHEVEVLPGYTTHVLPGFWKRAALQDNGTPGVYNARFGASTPANIVNLTKTGLLGIVERAYSGLSPAGASYDEDISSGCADNCTIRVDGPTSDSVHGGYGSGSYALIFSPDVFDRLDIHLAFGDSFGAMNPSYNKSSYFTKRQPLQKALKQNAQSASPDTEPVIRKGIDPKKLIRVVASSEGLRRTLIEQFKSDNITEVNGVPIEDYVTVREHGSSSYSKAIYQSFIKTAGYQ